MATQQVDPVRDTQSDTSGVKTKSKPEAKNVSNGVDIKQLLEAGAHFGHQTSRWHPRMAPYIHSKRDGNHIIDLTKTVENLERALEFITKTTGEGKQVLLVSTKRQAKDKVKEVALATNMPYVTERWLGGMLTNTATMGSRIKRLKDLESRMISGELGARYSKLEVQRMQEEIDAMNHMYSGVKELAAKPGAVFVADVMNDEIAVKEARKLKIPVIGIVDTNADPSQITYPIPANDDATKAINLIMDYVQAAIEAGKKKADTKLPTVDKKPEADSSDKVVKTEPKTEAKAETAEAKASVKAEKAEVKEEK